MYQAHWGLDESPFRTRIDPRFFYQSPTHEEALARLHFLVEHRRRLGLLLGPSGSGKSLLLEILTAELRGRGLPVARLGLVGLDRAELLDSLAGELGTPPRNGLSVRQLWRVVTDRLSEYRYQQVNTVLIFDDVDRADDECLAMITRLVQFDPGPESRLTVVLGARCDRVARLGAALLELVELRMDIEPWEPGDTQAYVQRSLARAGRATPLFAEPAVERLHELAQGIPRRVTQLADLALLAGAGRALDQIDAETVESVYHELGVIEV